MVDSIVALLIVVVTLFLMVVAIWVNRNIGIGILAVLYGLMFFYFFGRRLLALLCVPARILLLLEKILRSAFLKLATWIFRRWGAGLIRDIILGVSGFPLDHKFPVSHEPKFIGPDFYEFAPLPEDVIRQTLEHRSKDLGASLDRLTAVLSDRIVSEHDALSFLKRIANDTTLIHASYYKNDFCRQKIAEWLARDLDKLEREALENQWL